MTYLRHRSVTGLLTRPLVISILVLGLFACKKEDNELESPVEAQVVIPEPGLNTEAQMTFWYARADDCYQKALLAAQELEANTNWFLDKPASTRLKQLQSRWASTHNAFLRCQLYQSLGFNRSTQKQLLELTGRTNAWPIMGGYIDYLKAYPYSGLINDFSVPINAESLQNQHQLTDSMEVSLGFHALEFVIWGEDGERASTDFEAATPDLDEAGIDRNTNNRRRNYLRLVMSLLHQDIENLAQRWQPQGESGQRPLANQPSGAQASYLLTAMYRTLFDLVLERYFTPVANDHDIESSSSQSTKNEMVIIVEEIGDFLTGPAGENGQSLIKMVEQQSPEAALNIKTSFDNLSAALDKLPNNFPELKTQEDIDQFTIARRELAQLITDLVQTTKELNLTLILL